jgi:hypothetical protein
MVVLRAASGSIAATDSGFCGWYAGRWTGLAGVCARLSIMDGGGGGGMRIVSPPRGWPSYSRGFPSLALLPGWLRRVWRLRVLRDPYCCSCYVIGSRHGSLASRAAEQAGQVALAGLAGAVDARVPFISKHGWSTGQEHVRGCPSYRPPGGWASFEARGSPSRSVQ